MSVGVYDSGFGGLSVLRAIRARMPDLDCVYLGDSGRAPYGGRDANVILDLSEQCVERLFEEGCSIVVVACHTVSCVALRHLQARYAGPERRILGVTIPAAEAAVRAVRAVQAGDAASAGRGGIAFIGTARTVASQTFSVEVRKLSDVTVTEIAAPLLAPIVEEGWEESVIAVMAVKRYLGDLSAIDTLVLGCTHYPLLMAAFLSAVPDGVRVLDPSPAVADALARWFARHPEFTEGGSGKLRVLSTGDTRAFARHGQRFLGEVLPTIEHVAESGGRLAHRSGPSTPVGQVVR